MNITLIPSANHYTAGHSAATDTSTFTTLRLTLECTAERDMRDGLVIRPTAPDVLEVEIWTGPSVGVGADGLLTDGRLLHRFKDIAGVGSQRVTLTPDSAVQVHWVARSKQHGVSPGLVWSLSGTALPDPVSP